MRARTCVVTGANTGIGFEIARELAKQGATVVMGCRSAERGEAARAEIAAVARPDSVHVLTLDLASLASVRAFATEFRRRFGKLDRLVSNAGVVPGQRRVTVDGFEEALAVNCLGVLVLVEELKLSLEMSNDPRVVLMGGDAERTGKIAWEDLQSEAAFRPMTALGQSRLAQMLIWRELVRLNPNIAINIVDPGPTRTGALKELPLFLRLLALTFKSPAKAAITPVWLASSPEASQISGGYFRDMRRVSPSGAAQDDVLARRFWQVAEALVSTSASP